MPPHGTPAGLVAASGGPGAWQQALALGVAGHAVGQRRICSLRDVDARRAACCAAGPRPHSNGAHHCSVAQIDNQSGCRHGAEHEQRGDGEGFGGRGGRRGARWLQRCGSACRTCVACRPTLPRTSPTGAGGVPTSRLQLDTGVHAVVHQRCQRRGGAVGAGAAGFAGCYWLECCRVGLCGSQAGGRGGTGVSTEARVGDRALPLPACLARCSVSAPARRHAPASPAATHRMHRPAHHPGSACPPAPCPCK